MTATFKTVLYDLPTNALKTISSEETLSFMVPTSCAGVRFPYWLYPIDNDGYGLGVVTEYWSTPKYEYYAWEQLAIELSGDSCCGGSYDITIDNYIGKEYEADPQFSGCVCFKPDVDKDVAAAFTKLIAGEELTEAEEKLLENYVGEKAQHGTEVTVTETPFAQWSWTKKPNYTEIGKIGSLFSWMATDVNASFGIGSNFTLTIGSEVSFRGWENFSLGFGYTW